MRSDTRAIRDRVMAVLVNAERPLTTNDVCDRAGPYFEWRNGCQAWQHTSAGSMYAQLVECDGFNHRWRLSLACGQRGYRILRQLEAAGLVRREHVDGQREAFWIAQGGTVAVELDQLNAMWEVSQ